MTQKTSARPGAKPGASPGSTGSDYVSTIEILHQHTVGATRTEKVVIPIVLLVLAVILAGVLYVVWDHKSRDYRVAPTLGDVIRMAREPLAENGGLAGFLNPSDDPYVAVTVKSWQYWAGKGAVTGGHLLRMPDLRTESMEALVKGNRGAASLTLHLDLAKSRPPEFHVIEVLRGGAALPDAAGVLEIHPLAVDRRPAVVGTGGGEGYRESHDVAWNREASFRALERFIAIGRLQRMEGRFRIQTKTYSVALAPDLDPGLARILEDIADTRQSENLTYFLELVEPAPKAEREAAQLIGTARLDGVDFGKFYLANRP